MCVCAAPPLFKLPSSSRKKKADTVIEFTWVDVDGNVHVSKRDSPEGHMHSGGMGLIGVITEFTLQVTASSLTKLDTLYMKNDADLMGDIGKMLKQAPHILIFWRPDMHQYSAYLYQDAAPGEVVNAPDAEMTVLPSYATQPNLTQYLSDWQADLGGFGPLDGAMCPGAYFNSVMKTWASTAKGLPLLKAVAPTNAMQSAACGDDCPWTTGNLVGTAQDNHFAIEHDVLPEWIDDVQRIFKMDLQNGGKKPQACMGPGYMWLRFGRGNSDLLSMQNGLKRPVYVQSTWMRSRSSFQFPIKHGHVLDLIEEMTLCK